MSGIEQKKKLKLFSLLPKPVCLGGSKTFGHIIYRTLSTFWSNIIAFVRGVSIILFTKVCAAFKVSKMKYHLLCWHPSWLWSSKDVTSICHQLWWRKTCSTRVIDLWVIWTQENNYLLMILQIITSKLIGSIIPYVES